MENLITNKVKKVANEKALRMPIGTYSRLKVNNEISDIVMVFGFIMNLVLLEKIFRVKFFVLFLIKT